MQEDVSATKFSILVFALFLNSDIRQTVPQDSSFSVPQSAFLNRV